MRLTRTQGQRITKMEESVAESKRIERGIRAGADIEEREGHRRRAKEQRELADGISGSRKKQEAEIAARKANPSKFRW